MIRLLPGSDQVRSILFLGAHSDDIEIGCGATVARLRREYPDASVHWVVLSADSTREKETRAAAERLTGGSGNPVIEVHRFPDSYFPRAYGEIKANFGELGRSLNPDVIFTHRLEDRHQDHRVVSELTWNTFRDHLILEYEIPKYEGDLGQPNFFVPIEAGDAELKVSTLMQCFPTQRAKPWFTTGVFNGLMHIRGLECRSPSGLAEAFHARKLSL